MHIDPAFEDQSMDHDLPEEVLDQPMEDHDPPFEYHIDEHAMVDDIDEQPMTEDIDEPMEYHEKPFEDHRDEQAIGGRYQYHTHDHPFSYHDDTLQQPFEDERQDLRFEYQDHTRQQAFEDQTHEQSMEDQTHEQSMEDRTHEQAMGDHTYEQAFEEVLLDQRVERTESQAGEWAEGQDRWMGEVHSMSPAPRALGMVKRATSASIGDTATHPVPPKPFTQPNTVSSKTKQKLNKSNFLAALHQAKQSPAPGQQSRLGIWKTIDSKPINSPDDQPL